MMVFQGLSPLAGAAACAVGTSVLIFLHFLKVRNPGLKIPSIMLWRESCVHPRRQVLWEQLARFLRFLPPFLFIFCLCGALTEPVWDRGGGRKLVIVTDASGFPAAVRLLEHADPLRSALVLASGGGIILSDFGAPRRPLLLPEKIVSDDADAVVALAERMAAPGGLVCWTGSKLPPWLPENSFFIRSGKKAVPETPRKKVKIALPGASPRFSAAVALFPGVEVTEAPGKADLIFSLRANGADISAEETAIEELWAQLMRSGLLLPEAGQIGTGPAAPPVLPERRAVSLTVPLFLLAFTALAADILLWRKRKTV